MDYEKKYKEALANARQEYNTAENVERKRWLEELFPELKENADEKIRKNLITFLKEEYGTNSNARFAGIKVKDVIAWLEKQGQQRTTDKVEPKFKVGDWVVDNECGKLNQIDSVRDKGYDFANGDYMSYESAHKELRLWAIQDAEDGDVLEFGDHGRLVVGIISHINKSTGKVDVYCLLEANNFKAGIYYALDTIKPHPATKEQRDILFQKMKEAGYEFDFDRKKLKNIE